MTTKDLIDEVDEAAQYFKQEIFSRLKNTANLIRQIQKNPSTQ